MIYQNYVDKFMSVFVVQAAANSRGATLVCCFVRRGCVSPTLGEYKRSNEPNLSIRKREKEKDKEKEREKTMKKRKKKELLYIGSYKH